MAGLYIAAKYDESSVNKIIKMIDNIPNKLEPSDIHTTIIYSTKFDEVELPKSFVTVERIVGYDVWPSSGNTKFALVALLDKNIGKFKYMHDSMMSKYNLDYSYPEYKPHLTLSYDVPENILTTISLPTNVSLIATSIYSEDLKE